MPRWSQFSFQDAASPVMEEYVLFHDIMLVWLSFVGISVGATMISAMLKGSYAGDLEEVNQLEWIWTGLPGVVMFGAALPSLSLLYMFDEMSEWDVGMKINGYQWYWSYEYMMLEGMMFDCFMVPSGDAQVGGSRLLETDVALTLPIHSTVQFLATSKDVLHSWTVPSMGVKMDVVPGRVNTMSFYSFRPGVFFGQCSEICGAYHSFMPIMVEMVGGDDFIEWVEKLKEDSL